MAVLPVLTSAAESFVIFCEELSFTRAAERLAISQPSLHGKLKKFARESGGDLYHVEAGRVVVSPRGLALAGLITELQRRRDRFALDYATVSGAPVRISASEGAFLYLLSPILKPLLERHGNVFSLQVASPEESLRGVRDGDVDLAIGVFEHLSPKVEAAEIRTTRHLLACPSGHPLSTEESVCLADLSHEDFVVPPQGRAHRDFLDACFDDAGLPLRVVAEVQGSELMLAFVRIGVACAIVHDYVAAPAGVTLVAIADMPAVTYSVIKRVGRAEATVKAIFDSFRVEHGAA
jgi:DNA-binding transcriptional LysR family regulator